MSQEWTEKDVLKNPEHTAGTINACLTSADKYRAEIERLQADIGYVRDRLISRDDPDCDTITIRDLIDEATNKGDFFPSHELNRRKDQIHEINGHFKNCVALLVEKGAENDWLQAQVSTMQKLMRKIRQEIIGMKTPHPAQRYWRELWDEIRAVEAAKKGT